MCACAHFLFCFCSTLQVPVQYKYFANAIGEAFACAAFFCVACAAFSLSSAFSCKLPYKVALLRMVFLTSLVPLFIGICILPENFRIKWRLGARRSTVQATSAANCLCYQRLQGILLVKFPIKWPLCACVSTLQAPAKSVSVSWPIGVRRHLTCEFPYKVALVRAHVDCVGSRKVCVHRSFNL